MTGTRITRSLAPLVISLLLIASGAHADESDGRTVELAGNGYEIEITYPAVTEDIPEIGDSLEAYSDELMESFLEAAEFWNSDLPEYAMQISYTQEPSPQGLVCIMAWLWEYTGGAHGNYWNEAMVYDTETEEFVDPVGLLGDSTDFELFSIEVREEVLSQGSMDTSWVETGTAPIPSNYRGLLPIPDSLGEIAGFHVIFPPYYVGPYSAGSFEVTVYLDQYRE